MLTRRLLETMGIIWLAVEMGDRVKNHVEFGKTPYFWHMWIGALLILILIALILDLALGFGP